MTVNDVADLLFAARERIDFYWNFYVVIVIAIIGWLVSLKRTLTVPMKSLVTVVYLVASGMNLAGLYSSYSFAEALRTDLLRLATGTPLRDTRLLLEEHSYLSHRTSAFWIQLAVGATILIAVWFTRISQPEPPAVEEPSTNAKGDRSRKKRAASQT
jgi:hypothetical protein